MLYQYKPKYCPQVAIQHMDIFKMKRLLLNILKKSNTQSLESCDTP